jgi:glycosyltransferase involved in cell wall biosynthesis
LTNVDADDLVAFYTAADLFVLVSLHEGFGLPILEAMACGTPVVASRTTATGEITGAGGIQVDPQDSAEIAASIDHILSDANFRHQQITRGHEWCRGFSWERAAEQTAALYRRVLGEMK